MVDAHERVAGRVSYVINLELPRMLWAKLLRSSVAHGRIVRLDVSRARRVPGVAGVLTGADVARRTDLFPSFGPILRDQPILAVGKVRYVGEPVVAVAAEDLDAAQEALDLVEVEYEELPGVFDPLAALAPDAPLVHEQPAWAGEMLGHLALRPKPSTNVCALARVRKGDVERGFAEADEVFEDTFTSPAVQQVSLETHACLAQVEDGRITVWSTAQMPHMLRGQLAEIFKRPASHIRVIVPTLGGGFGGKIYATIEPIVALLAQAARRPVKLHLAREEEFVTIRQQSTVVTLKTGLKQDGTLVARKATLLFDNGAYAHIGPGVVKNGSWASTGPYAIPNVWADSYGVYTTTPPAGAFRGFGYSQVAWAHESHMDLLAERLGMDPYELRMKNLLADGQTFSTGQVMDDCHFRELLEAAARGIGWDGQAGPVRQRSRVRAKGLSCLLKATLTPSTSSASVKLNEDGSLNVLTSSVEMGQGLKTALAVLAAEQLDLPIQHVHVSEVDTDATPFDQGTVSSRSSYAMGRAVTLAAQHLCAQLLDHAAELLEARREDLEITGGTVRVRGVPERALDYGQLVRQTRSGNLLGHGTYASKGGVDPQTGQGIASAHFHQAAGAAEVEVDLETGQVTVLRYHGAVYAGRVINPVQTELQTEGGATFGLGQALFEAMVFEHGQLQNGNLADYLVPSIQDVPRIGVSVLEHPRAESIHGIGELTLPPVMPAIGNAVARATGVRIVDLPITPEKVLRALQEQGTRTGEVRAE
ncbi:MAG: xanthine dehydrogenase family protein molybdopterin-binding subunit [Chloroflexi bacterium]|nr:xanthine dehydrogenase family protein molybdopterin-binding subunit [Chloroflexota bacterium]